MTGVLTIPVLVSAGLKSFDAACSLCWAAEGLAGTILDSAYSRSSGDFAKAQKYAKAR